MAKKLVFDRAINMLIKSKQTAAVPMDELWKITTTDDFTVDGQFSLSKGVSHLIGQGANIGNPSSNSNCRLAGIVFKIMEV